MVNVFDGARRLLPPSVRLFVQILDGNHQQVFRDFRKGPTLRFTGLRCKNSPADDYTVLVSAPGYIQAGFAPVRIASGVVRIVSLMLLPSTNEFNFAQARWQNLKAAQPRLIELLSRGATNEEAAQDRYTQWMENHPASLATFFNVMAALSSLSLPAGPAFDFFRELMWDKFLPDRFFAYADAALEPAVAGQTDLFDPEPAPWTFHPGATSSYKQTQFGQANVQLTFHGGDKREIDGVSCILVEPDLDYYKDGAAHALLEVLPNALLHQATDPKMAYALRWMAGQNAGAPEFAPPYTIGQAALSATAE